MSNISELLKQDFGVAAPEGAPNKEVDDAVKAAIEAERVAIEAESRPKDEEVPEGQDLSASEEDEDQSPEQVEDENEEPGESHEWRAAEFAREVGMELNDFYQVKVPVNGEDVPLTKVVDGYKAQAGEIGALRQQVQQLEERATANMQSGAASEVSSEAMQLIAQAENWQKQLDEYDWSTLDPGQAANDRLTLMNHIQGLRNKAAEVQGEHEKKRGESMRNLMVETNKQLLTAVPEWNNPDVYNKEAKQMGDFLRDRGFTEREIFSVDMNAKAKLLVRDAMKALQKQAEIKKGVKKLNKLPKHLKPGARQSKSKNTLADVGKMMKGAKTRQQKLDVMLKTNFER